MAFRNFTRSLFQFTKLTNNTNQRLYSSIQRKSYQTFKITQRYMPIRTFSSIQTNDNAYRDLDTFLQKEIQLEKSAQKHPSKLPTIPNFQVQTNGPEATLTRDIGNGKVVVKFNVTNTVNASDSEQESDLQSTGQEQQQTNNSSSQLKSRPTFTVDINRGGPTLSFLCSYLPNDYPDTREHQHSTENEQKHNHNEENINEDFQIDEFTIHDGEWNETVYSSDCSVIDGELYDKLLNLLEEHGIGEEFANQLADFSTAYEHRQYIGLLEKLQQFVKK
ncbi:unnamed protein product [Rotaria sordida]|uniref:Complement component 1 Q subcomponent-binding protein, mitochondrial n=1 Tax=Rotaria sordida TaxID=392033 RepID=A0A818PTY1_9BILA|nr:unnamed protein product [Rotaria sordida]CAF0901224.1 unnamed protein product [Rotaria sordida]CAF0931667.1 unnamed protein product [Rotaria sordida]CAF1024184.1 unnamed protein product [Rotaria sordida]CAF3480550.1 unnamed protein product [Rotaria sordida]